MIRSLLVIPTRPVFRGARNLVLLCLHSGQKCSRIVEFARLAFGPGVELRGVDQNLAVRREFDMRAVHGTRRRSFEVYSFAVVSTAVAGAFELVFAGLPVWCAAEMCAARVDHEEAIGRAVNPYAIFLLELGIDAQCEF